MPAQVDAAEMSAGDSRRDSIVVAKSGLNRAAQSQRMQLLQDRAEANETVIFKSKSSTSKDDHEHNNQPLIHTDQLNTSSPTLFVFGQSPRRAIIGDAQQQQQQQLRRTSAGARQANQARDLDQEVQESRGGLALMSRRPDTGTAMPGALVRARLLVLNLEVTKSTATLSWSLAVQPSHPAPATAPAPAPAQQTANTINEKTSHHRAANQGRPKQRRRSVGSQWEPFHGARWKRDTIRVRPTLAGDGSHSVEASDESWPGEEEASEPVHGDLSPAGTQKALAVSPAKQVNESAATVEVLDDLPIGRRLQMSRVQSLPAPTNTRRPPSRANSSAAAASSSTAAPHPSSLSNLTWPGSQRAPKDKETETNQPSTRRRVQHNQQQQNGVRTRQMAQQSAPRFTSSTDHPMVKVPSVALNRISSNSTGGQRSSKSLRIEPLARQLEVPAAVAPSNGSTTESLAVASEIQTLAIKNTTATADDNQQVSSTSTTSRPSTTTTDVRAAINSTTSTPTATPTSTPTTTSTSTSTPTPTPTSLSTSTSKRPSTLAAVLETEASTATSTRKPLAQPETSVTEIAPSLSTTTTTHKEQDPPALERLPVRAASDSSNNITTSRWLVRLRRFGSNELDLIKIVINNLNGTRAGWLKSPEDAAQEDSLLVRQITFKNLSPSSGYEICLESLSPDQEIEDRYQILDFNQFPKCSDGREEEAEAEESRLLASVASANSTSTSTRSLCKEFLTLAENSNEQSVNFGQHLLSASRTLNEPGNSTSSNPRRPKSLQAATMIKSMISSQLPNSSHHIQMLEIDDIFSPSSSSEQQFELLSSRPNYSNPHEFRWPLQDLQSTGSATNTKAHNLRVPLQDFNLSLSALPILGCVFGLIFIITLVNILLNSISCWPQRRRRGAQSPIGYLSSSTSRRRHHHRGLGHHQSALGASSPNQQLGSSFYSGNSDISGGSQARFMVVGGKDKGEPTFAGSSVSFFEMPTDPLRVEPTNVSPGSSGSRHQKSSSSYLLSAQANRFPLGPSFEGDGKHNADMVGLARKNYDNFINNIYNPSESLDQQQAIGNPLPSTAASHRGHNHRHHDHPHCNLHDGHSHRISSPSNSLQASTERQTNKARPASSPLAGDNDRQQVASASHHKNRLKFDKINPIYHMEGLYGTRSTAMSSFGQVNHGLDMRPESPDSRSVASDLQPTEHCKMCEMEQQKEGCDKDCARSQAPPSTCNRSDDGQVQEFSCCLDRQQQRFYKQQQQLERVMSKNGSLVPQPFINPTISMSGDENESLSNSNRSDQASKQQVESYLFGDSQSTDKQPTTAQRPDSPVMDQSHDRNADKTLVSVGSMQKSSIMNETSMQKGNFDQRRKELASKLHLKGMK